MLTVQRNLRIESTFDIVQMTADNVAGHEIAIFRALKNMDEQQ
jgi:hypothetical protein